MAEPNTASTAGMLIHAAGLLAKAGIRATVGPRPAPPLEGLVDMALGGLVKRSGAVIQKAGEQSIKIATPDEARHYWEKMVPSNKWSIELLVGAQRTGKTLTMGALCEIYQRNGKPSIWVAANPRDVQDGLDLLKLCDARAISRKEFLEVLRSRAAQGVVFVLDDAVQLFNAYSSGSKETDALLEFLAVDCGKGENHCLIATQETGLLAKHSMLPSIVYCKPPLANYEDVERDHMRKLVRRAVIGYKQLPPEEWRQWVYSEWFGALGSAHAWQGMVPVFPPVGWSETLSNAR